MITETDAAGLSKSLLRALYMRVEAVLNTVALEYPPDAPNNGRTHLSPKAEALEKQRGHLNWRAYDAFEKAGTRLGSAAVEGRWLEPFRRKCFAETRRPELKRVNEVVSRIQDGILRVRVAGFEGVFSSEDATAVCRDLLTALNEFDYPTIATIADEHPQVRQVLHGVLAVTDEELIAMLCLDGDEWRSLGNENGRFDRYYQKRSA